MNLFRHETIITAVFYGAFLWSGLAFSDTPLPASAHQRVARYLSILADVQTRTVDSIISELEKSDHPMLNLEIKEAMAKTFADIVAEEKISGLAKKQWLYSKIALNMAYLQFGGTSSNDPLNQLILYKLKENLPAKLLDQHGFRYSLE